MKIGILAGEASGDLLGAKLLTALQLKYPNLQVEGIGGPAMSAAGCHNLYDIERLSVMGFIEPLLRLPELIRLRQRIFRHFIKNKPDIFIGIDAPDFNLGLEVKLRQAGIPVIHYVSPSVWAWRQSRVHKIAKAVDLMLTLLPFEAEFYQKHQIPVRYVGHPLAEEIPLAPDKNAARRALCIEEEGQYVALLPGSRRQEIRHIGETLIRAAKLLYSQKPHLKFLTAHVNEQRYQEFYECYQAIAPELPLEFFTRRSHDVMAAADVAIVTSGTATLETMLYKTPMVVAYKMSNLTYTLAKFLVKTPYIGLPNLLAKELIVPELIQKAASPEAICAQVFFYLDNPKHVQQLQHKFKTLHEELSKNSSACISEAVFDIISHRQ